MKQFNNIVEEYKLQFQIGEVAVIPVSAILLGLDRRFTPSIVTWLKLKQLLKNSYGSFQVTKIKFLANFLNLSLRTFKRHIQILLNKNLLRFAQDNKNLLQIVSQFKKGQVCSVGAINANLLFEINNSKECTYKMFRAFLTEVSIDLDCVKKISKRKRYAKTYGKSSKEFASLKKWNLECKRERLPIACAYTKLLINKSKSTVANYRKCENFTSTTYSNRVRVDNSVGYTVINAANEEERDRVETGEIATKNYGYYFINARRLICKRFIAIRKCGDKLVKRHCYQLNTKTKFQKI